MTASSDPHRDLAGVLHDVSNALTVLLGWVSEVRSAESTEESRNYALTIIEQRARIARDLARHAVGSPRIDEQRPLGSIVVETCSALKVEAQRKGARVVVRGAEASVIVAGALDIAQVLTNLVLNALAYAPSDSAVEVNVSVEDEQCEILVGDEGPGVAAERRQGIFRGDSLRPGGTGVGLRHSRALARAWGGDVELLEDSRKGARFRVRWPRVDTIPRPPVSTSRLSDLSGMRILVVEDDAAVTQLLQTVIEARGADVTLAINESQFAASLLAGPFDAALVDLSPIAGDLVGALANLRSASPDVKIILVTGNADGAPDSCVGPDVELVRKPFEVGELIAILGRIARRI